LSRSFSTNWVLKIENWVINKNMNEIIYKPIGIIYSPFKEPFGVPPQPKFGKGIKGKVEIFSEYCLGLKDIEGFSHIILIYHFHLSRGYSLLTKPHWDDIKHGLFTTRSPRRPNPIGISVVRLLGVKDCILDIEDVDIVNKTPLLDIKPYVPEFNKEEVIKLGWLEGKIKS